MKIEFEKPTGLHNLHQVSLELYVEKFSQLPNTINDYINVEEEKVLAILEKNFSLQKLAMKGSIDSKKNYFNETNYFEASNSDWLIVGYHNENYSSLNKTNKVTHIVFYYAATLHEKVVAVAKELSLMKKKDVVTRTISTVVRNNNGFYLKTFSVKKPKLKISDNYENIDKLHTEVLKRLNTKNDKGIALFYGQPGCGKTNYIRYLLTQLKKTVIYLPPDMASHISSPDFLPFLMDYPNSVLVIEDAENIIKSRKSGGTQSIANLLNLGDGLLSDILHIQIVATFNCDFNEIDDALVRKGRLIAKHEFNKLSIEKAQKLSDKLGFKTVITEEMPLCDIYNQDTKTYTKTPKRAIIGFNIEATKKESAEEELAKLKQENPDMLIPKEGKNFTAQELEKMKIFVEESMQPQTQEEFKKSWKKLKGK